ncbi:MAG: alpha/beta hydrolase [Pseudomonadota bacterium]|nr:alpha/beta hydrolase [Pseudomonadota bacterium]
MRMLIVCTLVALLVLGCAVALLYLGQRQMVYFPAVTRAQAEETDFSIVSQGVTLRGWTVNPGQRRAIVYFGGNAERVEASRAEFARWFPDATTYLLAYRGYGASEGAPSEAALAADAVALHDHVRKAHPDGRISAIGRSLGSGVASRLAAQRPIDRLVLVTPFASLADVARAHYPLMPVGLLLRERYETTRHLQGYDGQVLLIQAGRDRIVPASTTARLLRSLEPRAELVMLEDADHNDISSYPTYWQEMTAFLRSAGASRDQRDDGARASTEERSQPPPQNAP